MDRIGVVGLSWRAGGSEALARFTVPTEDRVERLRNVVKQAGLEEAFYLATCNRVELAFVGDGKTPLGAYRPRIFEALTGRAPAPGEAERMFRAWSGEGAAEHLFLVASGLDSARLGETEIVGQLRDAVEISREAGVLGPRLEQVLEASMKVAARVHRLTGVGEGRVSLAEIAIEQAREHLATAPGRVALVGVSPMTERAGKTLAQDDIPLLVVNRTLTRGAALAAELKGSCQALEEFLDRPKAAEVVILATGAQGPVLTRACLERLAARSTSGQPPLIIDLAVPPDVDPQDAEAAHVPRVGIDQILQAADGNRERRKLELAEARTLIDDALDSLRRRLVDRMLAPLLAAVQRRYRQTALEGTERLFRRELSCLGDKEREAVCRWAETLARRFAHLPSEGLRGLAHEQGIGGVEAFLARSDKSLARELEEAKAHTFDRAQPVFEEIQP